MFVSITRLRLRSLRFVPAFAWHTYRSVRQARQAPGVRFVSTSACGYLAAWTLTAWDNREAMLAYRNSGAHAKAMPRLKHWCDEATYAHWEASDDAAVTWEAAYRRHEEQKQVTPLPRPSPAHAALQAKAKEARSR